jgi:hypothetical protein
MNLSMGVGRYPVGSTSAKPLLLYRRFRCEPIIHVMTVLAASRFVQCVRALCDFVPALQPSADCPLVRLIDRKRFVSLLLPPVP